MSPFYAVAYGLLIYGLAGCWYHGEPLPFPGTLVCILLCIDRLRSHL